MRCSRLLISTAIIVLSALGIAQEKPATPPATPAPQPFIGQLMLVRYDMPRGRSDGYAPTRQLAKRRDDQDAIDWPELTLNGRPIFRDKVEEKIELPLRKGREFASPFQLEKDDVIQPGNHWFRAIEWRFGRRHIYTADRTARSANAGAAMSGRYELWTFPIHLKGEGGPVVKNVELRASGQVIYKKAGPWRSLTLLVPASEPGKPYELSVDGRPAVKFEAGLMPVKLGTPQERVIPLSVAIPGDGPKIMLTSLSRAAEFPNPKEWEADLAALGQPLPALAQQSEKSKSLRRHLGSGVPHSPMTIYATALPHGMSAGFYKQAPVHGIKPFPGNASEYAAHLAEMGFDSVFDPANSIPPPEDPESFENRAAALAEHGVKLGLLYDNNWSRPSLQHPNLAFFAHTLPEWHAPLYRSLSLTAQRFARWPNFAGINIGSDNAGYVSYWHWAPPIPDRPWGEAMIDFMGTPQPRVPRARSLGPREADYETPVATTDEFLKYVNRYETAFRQYGYFAEAVREIDPAIVFTTASFGSSPGVGGRGGWPWASIPGRVMFEGIATQQAYDWNELRASKPMHNVALVDRLRSYHPTKKTWALIDNFRFLFGREAMQRAYALALTRGVQGVGTNFLAHPAGEAARPEVVASQKELFAWIRKYGGVYARTTPAPVIGIFYGHHQAVQRRVLADEDALPDKLLQGSHEGKVTEALFLCHAAGWPARVITYQEVNREPLPKSMQAILLVGLNEADESWNWGPGLAPRLQQFLDRGGRILADDESTCPVPFTKTDMRVAAYVPQSNFDPTPQLITRNEDNIGKLRAAMEGVAAPVASSQSPTLWAIPADSGDTQYVTAVNLAYAEGDEASEMLRPADPKATKPELWKTKGNASLFVKPQTGSLTWSTERPIYDVRLGKRLTPEEAASVDLTSDAFRWYALPPAEVVAPELAIEKGVWGFFEAKTTMSNGARMNGLPVQLTVSHGSDSASVFSATGSTARLPLHEDDEAGEYTITATELLTGLSRSIKHNITHPIPRTLRSGIRVRQPAALAKFAARRNVALTVALTPHQERDSRFVEQAKALVAFYRSQGRVVSQGTVAPGSVVESLQPLKIPHRFPQWKTIASDLVLLGSPTSNVLLLDQARAQIFPRDFAVPPLGEADVIYTRSPFVGEYDALNIVASDTDGIAAAVRTITAPAAKK